MTSDSMTLTLQTSLTKSSLLLASKETNVSPLNLAARTRQQHQPAAQAPYRLLSVCPTRLHPQSLPPICPVTSFLLGARGQSEQDEVKGGGPSDKVTMQGTGGDDNEGQRLCLSGRGRGAVSS